MDALQIQCTQACILHHHHQLSNVWHMLPNTIHVQWRHKLLFPAVLKSINRWKFSCISSRLRRNIAFRRTDFSLVTPKHLNTAWSVVVLSKQFTVLEQATEYSMTPTTILKIQHHLNNRLQNPLYLINSNLLQFNRQIYVKQRHRWGHTHPHSLTLSCLHFSDAYDLQDSLGPNITFKTPGVQLLSVIGGWCSDFQQTGHHWKIQSNILRCGFCWDATRKVPPLRKKMGS